MFVRTPGSRLSFSWCAWIAATVIGGHSLQCVADESSAPANRAEFDTIDVEFTQSIRPLIQTYCHECHSGDDPQGELDLSRFRSLADVRNEYTIWQKVLQQIVDQQMPPEDSRHPNEQEADSLKSWLNRYLTLEAASLAGDPGPVVLRRLNNAEYTYTIRDLTGVPTLDPVREFPADSAAGEGFTNVGDALSMSPALAQKYFDAAREVSEHLVLLPDGIRFSKSKTRRDWADEFLLQIRQMYARHTTGNADVSHLDRWSGDPNSSTENDGRVDLTPYLRAVINQHNGLSAGSGELPKSLTLNAPYLAEISTQMTSDKLSALLYSIQHMIHHAGPGDEQIIAGRIRQWQDRLFRFQPIGHLGMIRRWQEPVNPIAYGSQNLHWQWKASERPLPDSLQLFVGTAGDNGDYDTVMLDDLRITIGGQPLPMSKFPLYVQVAEELRREVAQKFERYLNAAFAARSRKPVDAKSLAREFDCDSEVLASLLNLFGIAAESQVTVRDHLTQPLTSLAGHEGVNGWGQAGLDALSVVGNSTDETALIPGELLPHSIAVHPRPERHVAVAWKSPVEGSVNIQSLVRHAHNSCGNGVSWRVELHRRSGRRTLGAGHGERGQPASVQSYADVSVSVGDLVTLVIDARDNSHVCDLTQIDLIVTQSDRQWGLAADCANSMEFGNPHADRYGKSDVWHFFTELKDGEAPDSTIPGDSLLAKWMDADEREQATELAADCKELLVSEKQRSFSAADQQLASLLLSADGPLFRKVNFEERIERTNHDSIESRAGISAEYFDATTNRVVVEAPAAVPIRLPSGLFSELVISGVARLSGGNAEEASVQVALTESTSSDPLQLHPEFDILVQREGQAERQIIQAYDDFRNLFPAAMCHARIVPVDEVVTLVLYHREDDHFMRLMLSEPERNELNRLWSGLFFVSQDALRLETALEQILEFATQDADPSRFDPIRKPIAENVRRFREQQNNTQPTHLRRVMQFAGRAWRRSLRDDEKQQFASLYESMRAQRMSHDESIRRLVVRILTSPAFLYRLEQSAPDQKTHTVSDVELASRLSYFLWSSGPDDRLLRLAHSGSLSEDQQLLRQVDRMLFDDRSRRLSVEFAAQWLHVRDFDQHDEKSLAHFPEFAELRGDMYEETIRFFEDVIQNDRSVMDVFEADYVFVNERLAKFYGIPNVSGNQWRMVDNAGKYSRGGVLGMAATLAKQSGASRTSPILRGNWIYESLLGERLPKPPADVPILPETVPDGLTARQLIEQHSSVAECARCHQKIDPYGFALEGFDAVGRLRSSSVSSSINVKATLPDGTVVDGFEELRNYLVTEKKDIILRVFCRKLLGYSLGRSVRLSDESLLDEIVQQLEANDYRFSVAVKTIVLSNQFRKIRGQQFGQSEQVK